MRRAAILQPRRKILVCPGDEPFRQMRTMLLIGCHLIISQGLAFEESFLALKVVIYSPRMVPICFFGVFHGAAKKFSAFRFELSVSDVKDFKRNRRRTMTLWTAELKPT
jgi:hypothetical protein